MKIAFKRATLYRQYPYLYASSVQNFTNKPYYGTGRFNFYTPKGVYLGSIFSNVQSTIVNGFKWTEDEYGSRDFELRLTSVPAFPIQANTLFKFGIENDVLFSGYVTDYPADGNSNSGVLLYRGFGLRKYLDNDIYNGIKIGNITAVTNIGGATQYDYTYLGIGSPTVEVGGLVAVANSDEAKNNGISDIVSVAPNQVITNKFNSITDATGSGTIKFYPEIMNDPDILISDMFTYIIGEFINQNAATSPIKYESALVEPTTGYKIGGTVDFYNMTYFEIIQQLSQFVKNIYKLGINREGKAFCKKISETPVNTFVTGFNVPYLDFKLNIDSVKNIITVNRKKVSGTNQSGSEFGFTPDMPQAVRNSVALYGRREHKINVPGYYSDNACKAIANQMLQAYKDPKWQVTCKEFPYKYYEIDTYGAVSSYETNLMDTINDCENIDNIQIQNQSPTSSGYPILYSTNMRTGQFRRKVTRQSFVAFNAMITPDITYFMQGAGSLKCTFAGLPTSTWTKLMTFNLSEKIIRKTNFTMSMYILAQTTNTYLKWEQDNTDLSSNEIRLIKSDSFVRFDTLIHPINTFNKDTISLWVNTSTPDFYFWIDNVVMFYSGHRQIVLPLIEAKYNLSSEAQTTELIFGEQINSLDKYIAGITNYSRTNTKYLQT